VTSRRKVLKTGDKLAYATALVAANLRLSASDVIAISPVGCSEVARPAVDANGEACTAPDAQLAIAVVVCETAPDDCCPRQNACGEKKWETMGFVFAAPGRLKSTVIDKVDCPGGKGRRVEVTHIVKCTCACG
jgi:hypothetical protein